MTRLVRFCSLLFGASLFVTACGGGGGSALPAGPSQSKPTAFASAALSFFIPSASVSHARTKTPAYLPSTTQSIVVNVFNADGTPTSPATAPAVTNINSSACSAVSGGVQCTVTVTVPSGALLFTIAAYAQPNGTGALLSSNTTTATIGSGPNAVAVTLSAQTQYIGTNLDGGGMQSVIIDHQAGTFQVSKSGVVATSGTFTPLPNGDLKATITSASDSTPIGSIAYIREIANGALMFVATQSTTPSPDGSSSQADFGMMTSMQSCSAASGSFPINVIGIAGPNFPNVMTTHEAYDVGTASIASGTLNFSGTAYTFGGTNLGAASVSPTTCTNAVFSNTSGSGDVVYDTAGFLVVASGANSGPTPSIDGNFGFRAPAQPVDLGALTGQKYEGYQARFYPNQGTYLKEEVPVAITPGGSNTLTGCFYTSFEANSVGTGTNCAAIAFTAQPSPGLVTGTISSTPNPTPFVAAVGQVNGKYVIVFLTEDQSAGQAVNMAFMQQ